LACRPPRCCLASHSETLRCSGTLYCFYFFLVFPLLVVLFLLPSKCSFSVSPPITFVASQFRNSPCSWRLYALYFPPRGLCLHCPLAGHTFQSFKSPERDGCFFFLVTTFASLAPSNLPPSAIRFAILLESSLQLISPFPSHPSLVTQGVCSIFPVFFFKFLKSRGTLIRLKSPLARPSPLSSLS